LDGWDEKERSLMSTFALDIFSGPKNTRLAVMQISLDGGWDLIGGGFNTGGSWEWLFVVEEPGYTIVLRDKNNDIFGFLDANWSKIPNPDGHPPRPWFSATGIKSGTITIVFTEPSKVGNWKLRVNSSNVTKDDWRPRR
jgi:hypothetical protein